MEVKIQIHHNIYFQFRRQICLVFHCCFGGSLLFIYFFPPPVSDRDVMDVEKTYWALKGSNKLDLQAFQQHFSSLLPEELIPGENIYRFHTSMMTCVGWSD